MPLGHPPSGEAGSPGCNAPADERGGAVQRSDGDVAASPRADGVHLLAAALSAAPVPRSAAGRVVSAGENRAGAIPAGLGRSTYLASGATGGRGGRGGR